MDTDLIKVACIEYELDVTTPGIKPRVHMDTGQLVSQVKEVDLDAIAHNCSRLTGKSFVRLRKVLRSDA